MSDTPRTDDDLWSFPGPMKVAGGIKVYVRSQTARQLERELNAANARIQRLEEAGDEIIWAFCPASVSMMTERESDALKLWNKAKEAKP